jgi:hypothetical protein
MTTEIESDFSLLLVQRILNAKAGKIAEFSVKELFRKHSPNPDTDKYTACACNRVIELHKATAHVPLPYNNPCELIDYIKTLDPLGAWLVDLQPGFLRLLKLIEELADSAKFVAGKEYYENLQNILQTEMQLVKHRSLTEQSHAITVGEQADMDRRFSLFLEDLESAIWREYLESRAERYMVIAEPETAPQVDTDKAIVVEEKPAPTPEPEPPKHERGLLARLRGR